MAENTSARPRATEVLVVGAGPVGLALAAELARLGVGLRIVEQTAARSDKSKALVVWSRTLELMEIMGCADAVVAAGRKIKGAEIFARQRRLARLRLDSVPSPFAYGLFVPQSETERLLEEHLAGLGVTVEREVTLTGFVQSESSVAATLLHRDGTSETVTVRWLAGCDGAHSTVRHTLGMAFSGETENADFFLADIHLKGNVSADELALFWHPQGLLGIFPMTPGRYRVIADLGDAPDGEKRPDPTLAEVQAVIDQRGPGGISVHDPIWLSSFRINDRKVAHYRDRNVFLVGDAAHIHSPAGGQGMNTGIQDACNLAWKLRMVSRGLAQDALLDSYSVERSAVGEQVLKNAARLTRLAVMRNPVGQYLRNRIVALLARWPVFQHGFAMTMTELAVAYPGSPLSQGRASAKGGAKPGARAPDRPVIGPDGKPIALYRLLRGGRFVLLGATGHGREDLAALAARYPEQAIAASEPGAGALVVIRPDGYVGLVAESGDWAAADAYLASFLIARASATFPSP